MAGGRDVAQAYLQAEDRTKPAWDSFKSNVREAGSELDKLKGILTGLGVAVSAGALVLMVKQSIDAVAALENLSKASGASVESLSVMQQVAKLSGTSFEGVIIPAIQKLSKAMLEAQAGGGKAADAIRALKLNVEQANGGLKNAGDFMLEFAERLQKIDNETARIGFAEKIIKGGAQLIPFFHDLVEEGGNVIPVLAEQAAMADAYNATLTKLGWVTDATKRELALGLLPVLSQIATAMLGAKTQTGGLLDEMHKLREEGALAEWARDSLKWLALVSDILLFIGKSARQVIESISVVALDVGVLLFGFSKAYKDFRQSYVEQANKNFEERWGSNASHFGFSDAMDRILSAPVTTGKPRPRGTGAAPQLPDQTNENLLKQARDHIAGLDAETAKIAEQSRQLLEYGKVLDEAKEASERLAFTEGKFKEIRDAGGKGIDSLIAKETLIAARREDSATRGKKLVEEQAKAIEDLDKDWRALQKTADEYIRSLNNQTEVQDLERKMMFATDQERRTAIGQLQIEIALRDKLKDLERSGLSLGDKPQEMRDAAERAKASVAQAEALAEFKKTVDSVESTFHDAFTHMLVHGKDDWDSWAKSLKISFKTLVADELYKMFVKPIVVRLIAGIGGSLGLPGASFAGGAGGGGGGMGNLLSLGNTGSSFLNGDGLLGGIGTSVFGSTAAYSSLGFGGAQAALLAEQTGTFGLAGLAATGEAAGLAGAGALGAVGAAVPYVGLALAAYSLLSSGNKKTPAVLQGRQISGGSAGYNTGLNAAVTAIYNNSTFTPTIGGYGGESYWGMGAYGHEINSVYDQVAGIGKKLGRDASGLYGYTATINTGRYGDPSEVLGLTLKSLSDQLAHQLIPNLDQFAKAGESAIDTLNRLVEVQEQLRAGEEQTIRSLRDMARDLPNKLGIPGLTNLQNSLQVSEYVAPLDRFAAARQQLDDIYARGIGGDLSAVSGFSGALQQALGIGRDVYASGPQFQDLFVSGNRMLQDLLQKQRDLQTDILKSVSADIRESSQDVQLEVKQLRAEVKAGNDTLESIRQQLAALAA